MTELIIFILLAYSVAREIVFMHTLNKLVNKLMSRNYHEYKAAESVYQKSSTIRMGTEPDEDLNALDGINPVV